MDRRYWVVIAAVVVAAALWRWKATQTSAASAPVAATVGKDEDTPPGPAVESPPRPVVAPKAESSDPTGPRIWVTRATPQRWTGWVRDAPPGPGPVAVRLTRVVAQQLTSDTLDLEWTRSPGVTQTAAGPVQRWTLDVVAGARRLLESGATYELTVAGGRPGYAPVQITVDRPGPGPAVPDPLQWKPWGGGGLPWVPDNVGPRFGSRWLVPTPALSSAVQVWAVPRDDAVTVDLWVAARVAVATPRAGTPAGTWPWAAADVAQIRVLAVARTRSGPGAGAPLPPGASMVASPVLREVAVRAGQAPDDVWVVAPVATGLAPRTQVLLRVVAVPDADSAQARAALGFPGADAKSGSGSGSGALAASLVEAVVDVPVYSADQCQRFPTPADAPDADLVPTLVPNPGTGGCAAAGTLDPVEREILANVAALRQEPHQYYDPERRAMVRVPVRCPVSLTVLPGLPGPEDPVWGGGPRIAVPPPWTARTIVLRFGGPTPAAVQALQRAYGQALARDPDLGSRRSWAQTRRELLETFAVPSLDTLLRGGPAGLRVDTGKLRMPPTREAAQEWNTLWVPLLHALVTRRWPDPGPDADPRTPTPGPGTDPVPLALPTGPAPDARQWGPAAVTALLKSGMALDNLPLGFRVTPDAVLVVVRHALACPSGTRALAPTPGPAGAPGNALGGKCEPLCKPEELWSQPRARCEPVCAANSVLNLETLACDCAPGTALDSVLNRCMPSCPPDQERSVALQACVPRCPPQGPTPMWRADPALPQGGRCEAACPPGQKPDPATQGATCTSVCDLYGFGVWGHPEYRPAQQWRINSQDPAGGRCEAVCPAPLSLDSTGLGCKLVCGPDEDAVPGTTTCRPRCPAGFMYDPETGTACIPNCGPQHGNTPCQPVCKPGTMLSADKTRCIPVCSVGQQLNADQTACLSATATCARGTKFDPATKQCVTACPAGTQFTAPDRCSYIRPLLNPVLQGCPFGTTDKGATCEDRSTGVPVLVPKVRSCPTDYVEDPVLRMCTTLARPGFKCFSSSCSAPMTSLFTAA